MPLWSLIWPLAGALLITALTIKFEFRSMPRYKLGDIALESIKAPFEITVPDEIATARKKAAASDAVPAVFDLDSNTNAALETEIRGVFAQGRLLIRPEGNAARARRAPDLSRIQSLLQQKLGKQFPEDPLRVFVNHGFSRELENEMVELLQKAMSPGVSNNRDFLANFKGQGIVLRDMNTGEETVVRDVSSVRDLNLARNEVRLNDAKLQLLPFSERQKVVSYLEGLITANTFYNSSETRARRAETARDIDPVLLQIKKGKVIVRAGDEITQRDLTQLESLRVFGSRDRTFSQMAGVFALVCFFLVVLWKFLAHFSVTLESRDLGSLPRGEPKPTSHFVLLILVLIINLLMFRGFVWLGSVLAESINFESLKQPEIFYLAAPVACGAILAVLLVNSSLAVIYALMISCLAGLCVNDYRIVLFTLLGSFAAIFTLTQYKERSTILRCGWLVGLVNVFTVVALNLSHPALPAAAVMVQSAAGFLSAILAAMVASLLLPLLESLFGITTDIKLLELSNLNTPILRRLALEAPGTYHHSIIVGTLAEAAAEAIGANSLLVRVGSYYHDIGKMKRAEYYVENQMFTANKHEHLSPSMSSLIIASHVRDGLEMADEIKLPRKIRDLIPQHHGTRLMTYFFQKAKDAAEGKDQVVNESEFRYPGPKPQSREAAILMMADAVEAASRTLSDPTPNQILGMVKRIAFNTFNDGQFDECDITIKDLDSIAHAFTRVLTGMHHHRIDYPGFDFNKVEKEKKDQEPNQRIQ